VRLRRLRDDQWDKLKYELPGRAGSVGATAADNRRFLDAVLYRYRTGIPWRDLPKELGGWKNVHRRFSRWVKSGVFPRILALLTEEADNEYAMIDATIVRAHQHSAGAPAAEGDQAIGKSRGGLSTKIHVLADALGNPLKMVLTGGQVHDLAGADALLPDMEAAILLADKAYDAEERVIEPLKAAGKTVVIPPKRNRKKPRPYDKVLYEARHLVENFFCWVKQFRGIATRYDKTARNYLAAFQLVAVLCWVN
jgi:transposase